MNILDNFFFYTIGSGQEVIYRAMKKGSRYLVEWDSPRLGPNQSLGFSIEEVAGAIRRGNWILLSVEEKESEIQIDESLI